MKVCLAQTLPARGDIPANIMDHLRLIGHAVSCESECIFFPELSLTGYEPSLAAELALFPDDRRLDIFQLQSDNAQILIGVGAPVKIGQGCGIGMFLFEPNRPRRIYYKNYLHEDELPFFTTIKGFSGFLDTQPRIALAICYEISVDEHLQNCLTYRPDLYLASVVKFAKGVAKAQERLSTIAKTHDLTCMMVNSVGKADGDVCGGSTAVWDRDGSSIGQMDAERPGILVFDTVWSQVQIKYNT